MILEDRIKINASANKVFNWLIEHMKDTESYQKWHPEHKVMEWVKSYIKVKPNNEKRINKSI